MSPIGKQIDLNLKTLFRQVSEISFNKPTAHLSGMQLSKVNTSTKVVSSGVNLLPVSNSMTELPKFRPTCITREKRGGSQSVGETGAQIWGKMRWRSLGQIRWHGYKTTEERLNGYINLDLLATLYLPSAHIFFKGTVLSISAGPSFCSGF